MSSEGIGTFKHIQGRIIIDENVQAKFLRVWPVPDSLCAKVDCELDCQEGEGILSKVSWSE